MWPGRRRDQRCGRPRGIAVPWGAELARETAEMLLLEEDLGSAVAAIRLVRTANETVRRQCGGEQGRSAGSHLSPGPRRAATAANRLLETSRGAWPINSHIAAVVGQGEPQVGAAVQRLAEVTLSDPELDQRTRAEVLETIEDLAKAAEAEPQQRRGDRIKGAIAVIGSAPAPPPRWARRGGIGGR
jgi:hypothetical protein